MDQTKAMVKLACKALEEKKAENVKVIEIGKISTLADYFIIANGNSTPQIDAMVDEVTEELAKNDFHPISTEGKNTAGWILMDYQDVIIHIFSKQDRLFYDLERMWKDGTVVDPATL